MNYITYTREDVLSALSNFKGSIAYTNEDKERVLSNPHLTPLLDGLKKKAECFLEKPFLSLSFQKYRLFEETGNRRKFEDDYFAHRDMLESFALMAWIYDDETYLHALEDAIWMLCDEYSWAIPAHMLGNSLTIYQEEDQVIDLMAAETGESFAEILSILGDKLHPAVVLRMKKRLEERIFGRLNQKFHWMDKKICNWAAVCSGSVGMSAMLEIQDTERLADILMICLGSMDRFIGGYAEDGVCTEGIGYWGYGFGYFMAFADMLKRRTGGVLDLFAIPKVHLMATFIGKVFFPHGRSISFSDGGSRAKSNPSVVSFLKTIYADMPVPTEDTMSFQYPTDTNWFAVTLRKFIWMQTEPFVPTEGLDSTFIFPGAQWYLSTSENGVSIAAKAGHNNEAHNHNDVGSFQIFKNGVQILADLGSGTYDKAYFGPERYSIFCAGSQSHNVPIVNGKLQGTGRNYTSENLVIHKNGISYDFQAAYHAPELTKLHRDVSFDNEAGVVTIQDSFEFSEMPESLIERFVTEYEPKFFDGFITIEENEQSMSLYYDKEAWTPSLYVEKRSRGNTEKDCISYCIDFSPNSYALELNFSLEIK